jgi:hypothetical protein
MRGDRVQRLSAGMCRALPVLGVVAVAAAVTATAVRAQPMVRSCPAGASCAVFYTGPDLSGNADARDITDSPMCTPMGSIAQSVRNDTARPLALYSDHCTHAGLLATVDAGAKLGDIPGIVRSYASVTTPGG